MALAPQEAVALLRVLEVEDAQVRAPDVAFVRKERLPAGGIPKVFVELAPDLAVEIISPSETAADIRDKVADYLAAGTPLVLVAYPSRREIVAHTPDDLARLRRSRPEGETGGLLATLR